jgi:hypothetical protein
VDGNNIMPKQKKFRRFFESQEEHLRVEGQIRLVWLFAEAVTSEIFFDRRYDEQFYGLIKSQILTEKEEEIVNKVPVYFAEKHISEKNTADMKIVSRLTEIVKGNRYKGYDMVIVSADNELNQLCRAVTLIKKTSGMYIFKYCKKVIREKFYHIPKMRGIIKRIFQF